MGKRNPSPPVETEITVRKVVRVIADAGGTIKSCAFSLAMWPNDDQWPEVATSKKRPNTNTKENRLARRAGSLLGRLASRRGVVTQIAPQTWSLTPEGWRMLSSIYTPPSVKADATAKAPQARIPIIQGAPHPPHQIFSDPRFPAHVAVVWRPGMAPQWLPAHLVQWRAA